MEPIRKIKINGEERELVADISDKQKLAIAQDVAERIALEVGENTFVKQYSYNDGGTKCYDLILGQEYRLVYTDSYDFAYATISVWISPDGGHGLFSKIPNEPDGTTNHHTLKVLGMENNAISYEYDGVLYTKDFSFIGNYAPNELRLTGAYLEDWGGELYLVNDSGLNTREQIEQLNAKTEELETAVEALDAKIEDIDTVEDVEVLKSILLKPVTNSVYVSVYGYQYDYLKVGKEYRAVRGNVSYPEEEFTLKIRIAEDDGTEDTTVTLVSGQAGNVACFTFKLISVENSVITYELNGNLETLEPVEGANTSRNKVMRMWINDWQGELYEVFDATQTQQRIAGVERSVEDLKTQHLAERTEGETDFYKIEIGKTYQLENLEYGDEQVFIYGTFEGVPDRVYLDETLAYMVERIKVLELSNSAISYEGLTYRGDVNLYTNDISNRGIDAEKLLYLEIRYIGAVYHDIGTTVKELGAKVEEVQAKVDDCILVEDSTMFVRQESNGKIFDMTNFDIEFGKEYRAVATDETINSGFCVLACLGDDDFIGLWSAKYSSFPHTHRIKLIGIENSILSLEWDGELKTKDLTDITSTPLNTNMIRSLHIQWEHNLYGAIKNGEDGKDGRSTYEIAVDNGFEGTEEEWIAQHDPNYIAYLVLNSMPRAEDWVL